MKSDLNTVKDMDVIGTDFQLVIDSNFWYLPCASVRQCKYVMDKAGIGYDKWTGKSADLAAEHKMTGARNSLHEGLKHWLTTDMFKEH